MANRTATQPANDANRAPSHNVYVVTEPKREGQRAYWTKVGAAWEHGDGEGFNIQITDGISVSGRLVIREPKADEAGDE